MPEVSLFSAGVAASSLFLFVIFYLRPFSPLDPPQPVKGKSGTVLFVSTENHGQINVQLAAVQALLERYPSLDIHFASAQPVAKLLHRISSSVRKTSASFGKVTFHDLPGLLPMQVTMQRQFGPEVMKHFRHEPGAKGSKQLNKIAQASMAPWTTEEYVRIYNQMTNLIHEVDPALVVLDFAFRPAIAATHKSNRVHTFLTPTSLIDMLPMVQPQASILWKYPVVGTDFPFPLPWRKVPENIYVAVRALLSFAFMADLAETKKQIAQCGIDNAFGPLNGTHTSWIMQNMLQAGPTVDPIPDNVVCVNPIVFAMVPAIKQDPELVSWTRRTPTVLICLGSLFEYDLQRTEIMGQAIKELLKRTDVQVLWKFGQENLMDDAKAVLQEYIDQGRVQIYKWLSANPVSLLETGHIVASVHHGGANSYNEALSAGVPQVIVPMWTDLFNHAQRVEDIGVGIYATRGTAPEWTVNGLSNAFLKALDGERRA
ncbi:hypothetical protein N7468_003018 [Penicillium chermesinum]|uniref:Erythromycin biosynthesis protein CIII-like C-terminal domain-containing protein n=1 Tax=Penicillium chermesinum TaxID=63820 RepID=A0A9W9P5P0_9EURO|nr:uncharacterized protein N7468_003018 [Penicillium chermesinum]KAJ5238399.1 hypothetical protein N7468_003018 [Penicillium chermesinum]